MAAPKWVCERLDNWGRWMSERGDRGLGYPRSNILAMHRGSSASVDHVPVNGVQAGETHRAVSVLRVENVRLWMALQCRYVGNPQVSASRRRPMLYSEIGTLLAVSEATASAWVQQGQFAVAATLDRWALQPAIG